MQADVIADIPLSVTLSSQVQGRIAKKPEQEVKQCRSFARPPSFALMFAFFFVFFLANFIYFSS
jgi:hypothetical protein